MYIRNNMNKKKRYLCPVPACSTVRGGEYLCAAIQQDGEEECIYICQIYKCVGIFAPNPPLALPPLPSNDSLSLQFHNLPLHLLNRMQQYPR